MTVGCVVDDVFLGHVAPAGHAERPERLIAVREGLEAAGLAARGTCLPVRCASEDELGLVHTAAHISELSRVVPGRSGYLDADTFFSRGTWEAALSAVGAAVDLTRGSLEGRFTRGFGVVRPPGHHAEPDKAMGFCLFNNIAIAAAAARAAGAGRVAIVDWDVHHGNGTQAAFYRDPAVLFISTHQSPLYPGTGMSHEIGAGEGEGTTLNVPLPPGAGDAEYAAAFDQLIAPALRHFRPDLILVSSGFDAYAADPLAQMRVSAAGFRRMAMVVRALADEVCGGRMVALLEGGYDLDGLGAGAAALFDVLASTAIEPPVPSRDAIHAEAQRRIDVTRRALAGRLGFAAQNG